MIEVNIMATILFWHGFDNSFLCGGDTKLKLPNGNGHVFSKQEGETSWSSTVVLLYQ